MQAAQQFLLLRDLAAQICARGLESRRLRVFSLERNEVIVCRFRSRSELSAMNLAEQVGFWIQTLLRGLRWIVKRARAVPAPQGLHDLPVIVKQQQIG